MTVRRDQLLAPLAPVFPASLTKYLSVSLPYFAPSPTMPWKQVEHEFTYPEVDYASEPNYQPCIKVSVFFRKIDSIDHDTFFGHWRTVHADLAVATNAFRDHIVRYAQVRTCGDGDHGQTETLTQGTAPPDPGDEGAGPQPR